MLKNEDKRSEKAVKIMEVLEKYLPDPDDLAKISYAIVDLIIPTDRLENVADFVKTGGRSFPSTPTTPNGKQVDLFISIIFEELKEYAQACGTDGFYALYKNCLNYTTQLRKNYDVNLVDQVDALVDLEYVLYNAVLGTGLGSKWNELHQSVHLHNMTKFCVTEKAAKDTVEAYENGTHPLKPGQEIICDYRKSGEYYVVYRKSDGKILKSIHHKSMNYLGDIIYNK